MNATPAEADSKNTKTKLLGTHCPKSKKNEIQSVFSSTSSSPPLSVSKQKAQG